MMLKEKNTIIIDKERFKMPKRIKIPQYAKVSSKKGLKNRNKGDLRFTSKESRDLGIYSGECIAKKICSNKFIEEKDLRKIARFYKKFKNSRNKKTEEALLLWGGRKFCKFMYNIY